MRSGSRCPAFYGEIPPMRWGILDDDGGYFYCITYNWLIHTPSVRENMHELLLRYPLREGVERVKSIILGEGMENV